jgi:hypothetical protein
VPNKQWTVTLDDYLKFVIARFEPIFGSRSLVIKQMLHAWISEHPDQVRQADATFDTFLANQASKKK